MVKSLGTAQHHQEEEDEDDYEHKCFFFALRIGVIIFLFFIYFFKFIMGFFIFYFFYKIGETVKAEGKGSEQKTNTNQSKHSESEQRRRSKINERFQTLRDLIPQNDQKRDKASFLLEVIEYVQLLQEKLHMCEGSCQEWSQEPTKVTKLIPWRNHHALTESFIDHSQVVKNGSNCENDVVIPSILANTQNSIESDLGNAAVFKAVDHPPGSATSMVNMQTRTNTFATHGSDSIPTNSFHESASDSENIAYRPQFHSWQGRECLTKSAVLKNSENEQEDLTIRGESVGLSSAYSQGLLNSLTQALQSSGVDVSQEKEIQYTSNQVMAQTGAHNCTEESDQAYKRRRTVKS